MIAGGPGWLTEETFHRAERSAFHEDIHFEGFVPDDDLIALYSGASVFAYPSYYEGSGLPIWEAMACGAPVIASRIAALQETLGDAAILIEPLDVLTLSRTIIEVLKDERRRAAMGAAGIKYVAKFSWDKAAMLSHELYAKVLAS